jgi:hypothetical protein
MKLAFSFKVYQVNDGYEKNITNIYPVITKKEIIGGVSLIAYLPEEMAYMYKKYPEDRDKWKSFNQNKL